MSHVFTLVIDQTPFIEITCVGKATVHELGSVVCFLFAVC